MEKMFAVSALCLAVLCSLLYTADAAITDWATPLIATKDGNATVHIAEDMTGTILVLAATKTGTGTLSYSILSQPATAKLNISTANLILATGKKFDFETETSYVVVVKCVDSADNLPTGTATATITLNITNVNEPPVFASLQYATTIPDGSGAGTTLTTVKATDPDAGNTVTYTIDAAGNTGTVFIIGANTGIITVAPSKTTDAATTGGFQLTVKATDNAGSPLFGTTIVWVAVTTCSSNAAALIASGVTMLVAFVVSLQ